MGKSFRMGVCMLALSAVQPVAEAQAAAKMKMKCASPEEMATIQVSAVQQGLMDAALGCGEAAIREFNDFQTAFGPELRKSDALMLKMFKRIMGNAPGDAAYNAFKTRAAGNAEIRRVRGMTEFCRNEDAIFALALAPPRPALQALAASVPVLEASPVASCLAGSAANSVAANLGAPASSASGARSGLSGDPKAGLFPP